jgi:DNA-binding MarR family transcriptional regulator
LIQLRLEDPSVEAWISIVGAYKTVHALLNQQLVRSGFTFPQYRVIRILGRFGAIPMNKLGEHMFVTPGNVTGLVDRLERRGCIERVEKGADRRIIKIGLTKKGRGSYRQISADYRKLVNSIMKVLSKEELSTLTTLLQKVKEAALEERRNA